jgi:hypothetical protein
VGAFLRLFAWMSSAPQLLMKIFYDPWSPVSLSIASLFAQP